MKRIIGVTGLLVWLFLAILVLVPPPSAADQQVMVVGRIYHIEGDLLRYVPEDNDWVAVVRDAPVGEEDTLFSGDRGMAELIIPNGTWIRVGNSTQIQVIALDADLSEMDVATGVARFYNKSSATVIKATSPFGYVLADHGTVFDFYVGENSVEAVAIKGKVSFIHAATDARYNVSAGSPSILADQQQVSSGDGAADPDWNRWNMARENFWVAKARVRGRSAEYLPPNLRDEAYALEENGRWERVPYEGEERWFWRPTTVGPRWSPFTVGRWTDWYGDQTWIPAEPFGYVTHHYGNWVYVRNSWFWAPPVVSVRVGLPLLNIGFSWNPGRVSWIHTGAYVGWVPLAPRETYYSRRPWGGPHTVVVTNVNIAQININVRNYAYANHAVVVNQNHFYRVNSYRDVQAPNINRAAIINNYRAAPVVNNTVINNYTTNKQRYHYTNVTVKEKPHETVINRIQHNKTIIQGGRKENAAVVQEQAKSIKEGRMNREVRIEPPKSANYIVPADEVNRPKSEMKFPQREIIGGRRDAQQVSPGQAGETERVSPAKPAPPEGTRPEREAPVKPSQPEKPGRPAERETEKLRGHTPADRVVEAPADGKAQERKGRPEKPQEVIRPPERGTAEIPRKGRPTEKVLEKSREVQPPVKAIEKPKSKLPEGALEKPKDQQTPERGTAEMPREGKPTEKVLEKSREVQPPVKAIEKPKSKLPEGAVEKPKDQQTPERGTAEMPREGRPTEKVLEKSREVQPPVKAIEKPKSKLPEGALEKPKDQQTPERQIEKPREQRPVQKQIEQPQGRKPAEKGAEKRIERKRPGKEEEEEEAEKGRKAKE